ncbi:hypothetical protein [Salipiger sp.]|uniref:hypothetical protein n=1 Tax=Salipiger sp. TaxID=2078585 RepID=UPI003A9879D9
MRQAVLSEIKAYFDSDHWGELEDRVENHSDSTLHAHVFVDTRLHPETFCDVLRTYYAARGMEIRRTIDFQPSNVGHNMLHGVYPQGTFHYDVAWRYADGPAIAPMPEALVKERDNLQIWGVREIEDFFARYDFVTDAEAAAGPLDDFFASPTWARTAELVEDRTVAHFHTNVEMNIHPDLLMSAALRRIERRGWKLQKTLHCIFSPRQGWTTGKVVFMLDEPEVMFDIAWSFNPDVSIRPSTFHFMLEDDPAFDVRRKETLEYYTSQGAFLRLDAGELGALHDMLRPGA